MGKWGEHRKGGWKNQHPTFSVCLLIKEHFPSAPLASANQWHSITLLQELPAILDVIQQSFMRGKCVFTVHGGRWLGERSCKDGAPPKTSLLFADWLPSDCNT